MAQHQQQADNRFERRAELYAQTAQAQARRLADMTDEPPANSTRVAGDQARQMWQFSPYGTGGAEAFYAIHDGLVAEGRPVSEAEDTALSQAFPYRAKMVGRGSLLLEDQVKRAERLRRLADGEPSAGPTVPQDGGVMP